MSKGNDLIDSADACYLLVKRGLYYRPNCQGYTGIKEQAGRYTRADGEQLSRSGVTFVHVNEAGEYSPSCDAETKAEHLQAALADRDATIASLSEALAEAEKKGAEAEEAKRAERHRIFRLLWDHSAHVGAYPLGLLVKDDASVTKALPPRDLSRGWGR